MNVNDPRVAQTILPGTIISVDLLEAARRSESFPSDWSDAKVRRALKRYEQFLLLAAKHPGLAVAPTHDIDEMWHLHMLSPRAYYRDCMALFGEVLDHDGGFGKEPSEVAPLKATFERTVQLWEAEFGEAYVEESERKVAGVNCWHDCQGRCWHACQSKGGDVAEMVVA